VVFALSAVFLLSIPMFLPNALLPIPLQNHVKYRAGTWFVTRTREQLGGNGQFMNNHEVTVHII
jgi:hypothetical protein